MSVRARGEAEFAEFAIFACMKLIGNILWVVLGGFVIALFYYVIGLLMCITVVGIPFGIQLFKLGTFSAWPLGACSWTAPGSPDAYPR